MSNYFNDISNLYDDILEEGLKGALMGGALGLAGLMGGGQMLANKIVNDDQAEKSHVDPSGAKVEIATTNKFSNPNKVASLVQQYFKLKGKNVQTKVQGDSIIITSEKGSKTISMFSLKNVVQAVENGETNEPLGKFLADRL